MDGRFWIVTAVVALAAMLAAVANAGARDGRSPDAQDAAAIAGSAQATVDRRSPDTSDAGLKAQQPPPYIAGVTDFPVPPLGIRSRRRADAALGDEAGQSVLVEGGSSGFDWADAGIGAAGGFAIAFIVAGALVLPGGRRGVGVLPKGA
jgi:hypothetical protein